MQINRALREYTAVYDIMQYICKLRALDHKHWCTREFTDERTIQIGYKANVVLNFKVNNDQLFITLRNIHYE